MPRCELRRLKSRAESPIPNQTDAVKNSAYAANDLDREKEVRHFSSHPLVCFAAVPLWQVFTADQR